MFETRFLSTSSQVLDPILKPAFYADKIIGLEKKAPLLILLQQHVHYDFSHCGAEFKC